MRQYEECNISLAITYLLVLLSSGSRAEGMATVLADIAQLSIILAVT